MFVHEFTRSGTAPHPPALQTALQAAVTGLRTIEPIVGDDGTLRLLVGKDTAWQASEVTAVQTAITAAPASSPVLAQQAEIDRLSTLEKAVILTLLDQINTLRQALPTPLPAVTPQQAIAAIRAKAGTL